MGIIHHHAISMVEKCRKWQGFETAKQLIHGIGPGWGDWKWSHERPAIQLTKSRNHLHWWLYTFYILLLAMDPNLKLHPITSRLTWPAEKEKNMFSDFSGISQDANTQNQPRNQPFTTLRPLLKQQNEIWPTNMVISSEKWTVNHLTNKEPVYLKQTIPSSSTNVGKTWSNLAPPNEDLDHVRILKTGMSGCHMTSDWEVH